MEATPKAASRLANIILGVICSIPRSSTGLSRTVNSGTVPMMGVTRTTSPWESA